MFFFITEYVDKLLDEVVKLVNIDSNQELMVDDLPPPLCSAYSQPDKMEAISKHRSRFSSSKD